MTDGAHIREEDLELFALGALPEDEAAALKAHVGGCGECARKLAEARGSAAMLAFGATQEKLARAVKEKLFARIAAERGTVERETRERPVVREERKTATPWWNWVLVPTAVALAVVCLMQARQNRRLGDELRVAHQMVAGLDSQRKRVEEMLGVLAAPDTISVKLAGTSDAAQATGFVKYNGRLGMVLYSAEHLPSLPEAKVYQMWLVPTSGAPISAGVFVPGEPGKAQVMSAQVPANTEPKAFAVTIEPEGGVPQPTGPKVLLGAS